MISRAGFALTLTALAFAAGYSVAQTTTQTGREPQFDNSEVKVWKSLVLPNSPLPLHRHEHLPANAPGTRHQDVNVGDKPIEVMVVELEKGN